MENDENGDVGGSSLLPYEVVMADGTVRYFK
jgi:hypothetical protein